MAVFLLTLALLGAGGTQVRSPNGQVHARFTLKEGRPQYAVSYRGKELLAPSALGLTFKNAPSLDGPFTIIDTKRQTVDSSWEPIVGKRQRTPNHYNALTVTLRETSASHRRLLIIFRVYDEGVGFRYRIPQQPNLSTFKITAEYTRYRFGEGTRAYSIDRPQAHYKKSQPLDSLKHVSEMPFTVQKDSLFLSLMEAHLDDYSRTRLVEAGPPYGRLAGVLMGPVTGQPPFDTPWRLLLVGQTPKALLNHSYLVRNLNPPNALSSTSWIKPGKAIRVMSPLTTKRVINYVDFAATHNMQYVHFDTGWYGDERAEESNPFTVAQGLVNKYGDTIQVDLDLPDVVNYARKQDVGVILYVNHTALEEYDLDKLFSAYHDWGIAGVKPGFVEAGPQRWTNWLHRLVRVAARHKLIVDVHDLYRPTGFSRTYPNLLTVEGIGGDETHPAPLHELTLPFTRMLAGPADHTYSWYSTWLAKTHAFQLAAPVVFYSPLQYLFWYDDPKDYQGEPALSFWKHMPTTWDESQVLQGAIGKYVSVARRNGEEWFVGSLNGPARHTLEIPLDFLEKGKQYVAYLYIDAPNVQVDRPYDAPVQVRRFIVDTETILRADLRPGGGQAVRLTPATSGALKHFADYPPSRNGQM